MGQVPDELLHAGRVDGCSELRLWWEIALPIVRPMVGAFTLMTFIGSWNSFLWPQVVLQDEMKYNLPIGLANMVSQPDVSQNYSVLMCGTFLSILPVMLLFAILQKDFIAGLASGAVKG
jgi:ABC-type glycerol-3-phosphate transport system permease component